MNSITWTVDQRAHVVAKLHDYAELCKLRISVLVLVTVALSAVTAAWGSPDVSTVCHTLFGTAMVAFSASALNQWLERDTDAVMDRTSQRPLPACRLGTWEVTTFGVALLLIGVVYLFTFVNAACAGFGLATWVVYVVFYTPLKRLSTWNTFVGAIAGALPVLIGWSAVGDLREDAVVASAFFLTVFIWQFPHFMAIAWIYREQYAKAGLQMSTVVDPTGQRAGVQAVLGALALLIVTLIPVIVTPQAWTVASWTMAAVFLLGAMQLLFAISFCRRPSMSTARRLLRASIIYLPTTFLLLAIFITV